MSFSKIKKARMAENKPTLKNDGAMFANGFDFKSNWPDVLDAQDQIKDDILYLRTIEKIADKKSHKESVLLPRYTAFAERGMREQDPDYDDFVFYCATWSFDIGDMAKAIELAKYASEHDIETPQGFSSNSQTFFSAELFKWAMPKIKSGESVEPFFSEWLGLSESFEEIHMIEKANILKCAGFIEHAKENYEGAVELYERAIKVNERVGVSGKLKDAIAKKPIKF